MKFHIKVIGILFLVLFLVTTIQLCSTAIPPPPTPPHAFYGTVTINGNPAPDGVKISVWVEGTEIANTTTSGGEYLIKVPVDANEGKTAYFYVGEIYAASYVLHSGYATELDLSVTDNTKPSIADLNPTPDSVVGPTITISAKVSDPGGVGVNPNTITMKLDGSTVSHTYDPSTGTVSYTPPTLSSGYHTVELSVKDYADNENSTSWTFRVITGELASITLVNTTTTNIIVGDTVTFIATAYDDAGNPKSGVHIYLYSNDTPTGVDGYTDANGNVTLTLEFTLNGTFMITARSDTVVSNTITVIVTALPVTSVTISPLSATIVAGESVTFKVNVTSDGTPVKYRTVEIYVNGTLEATGNTGSTGTAEINVAFTDAGNYTVYAKADGVKSENASVTVWPAGVQNLTLTANTTSIHAWQSVELYATARNATGGLMEGITVNFYYANGTLIGSAPTNATGVATKTITLTEPGNYTVYAVADTTKSNNVTITVLARTPTNITLTSDRNVIYVNEYVTFYAKVNDTIGPTPNVNVSLYVNGVLNQTSMTNMTGIATFTVTFSSSGNYTVYAVADSIKSNNVTITVLEREVGEVHITANKTTVYVAETVTFNVTVYDTLKDPLPNAKADIYANNTLIAYGYTNENGIALINVTFVEGGNYTVYAKVGAITSNETIIITVLLKPVERIELSADKNEIFTNEYVTFTAYVYTTGDEPVPYRNVTLYINEEKQYSNITDINGKTTFTILFDQSGNYTVYAVADSIKSNNVTITVRSLIGSVTLENLTSTSIIVGRSVTFKTTVLNSEGNPVEGVDVILYINHMPKTTKTTNSSGVAVFIIEFLSEGNYTVYAMAQGITSNTINVEVLSFTVNLTATTTKTYVGGIIDFTVTVLNTRGNPLPNMNVLLIVDLIIYSNTTNSEGNAFFSITFNMAKNYTVYAIVEGIQSNVITIVVTQATPPNIGNISLTASTTNITVGESITFNATVYDPYGNPLPNVTVRFLINYIFVTSIITNENGTAIFTYQFVTPGTYEVKALAADKEATVVVNVASKPYKPSTENIKTAITLMVISAVLTIFSRAIWKKEE